MRKLTLAAGLVVLFAALASAQAAKPDFSGTWTADLAKSDFGPMPPPSSIVLVVVHKDPSIKVTSTQNTADAGEVINVRNLTTDGKPNQNKMKVGGGEEADMASTTKWDGAKLVTSSGFNSGGADIKLNDTWELSADGKMLTISREIVTPDGTINVKTVYAKK